LNAQIYRNKTLRPIVMPFIRRHHLLFHDNSKCPSSSMDCILTRHVTHPLSMFGMLWIDMYDSVFQFPPASRNFSQPLKRIGTIPSHVKSID
jgi:hypothetical protein